MSERERFLARYRAIAEHSPWVAEAAFELDPDDPADAFTAAISTASADDQLRLIQAHPDLAGKAALAGEVTDASAREQASAGLDRLTKDELAEFHRLNDAYRARFGFPFIICVREHSKRSILAAYRARLGHDDAWERATAVAEIVKIARLRIRDLEQG